MSKYEETFEAILGPPPRRQETGAEFLGFEPGEDAPADGEPTLREALEEWAHIVPPGVVALPTYVCDLVLKNLSLAEQSVLLRLFRLAGGLDRRTERVRPTEIAKACGIRATLVNAAIRALRGKGLLAAHRRNPVTGSARFRLSLPAVLQRTVQICTVCHRLIDEEEESWLPVPISLRPNGSYQYVRAHAECLEGATL